MPTQCRHRMSFGCSSTYFESGLESTSTHGKCAVAINVPFYYSDNGHFVIMSHCSGEGPGSGGGGDGGDAALAREIVLLVCHNWIIVNARFQRKLGAREGDGGAGPPCLIGKAAMCAIPQRPSV